MGAEAEELGHRDAKRRPVWHLIWQGRGGETVSPHGVVSKPLQFQRRKMLEVVWQQWVELGRESSHRGQRNSEEGMRKWAGLGRTWQDLKSCKNDGCLLPTISQSKKRRQVSAALAFS